jgi:hypothetical protein
MAELKMALERGVEIKIMCADPEISGMADMLARIDPQFDHPEEFS